MDKPKPLEKFFAPLFIAGLFVLGLSLIPTPTVKDNNVQVSFLGVGQGDASLIKTINGKYILIDGGPDKSILAEMGKLMLPTERSIEAVILSHPHADHVAGLNYVLDRYRIGKVYLAGVSYDSPDYEEFLNKIRQLNIPAEKLFEGKNIYIDEVKMSALWPKEEAIGQESQNVNNNSIVFDLNYKNINIFYTGDISAESQESIADDLLRPVDVFKVPHHGSRSGISENLFEALQPKYSIISVGEGNRYGHPSEETLLALSPSKILRTDYLGTITFYTDGNTINLK